MKDYLQFIVFLLKDVFRAFPSRTLWSQLYQLFAAVLALFAGGVAFVILLSFEKGRIDAFGTVFEFDPTDGLLIVSFLFVGSLALARVVMDFLSVSSINRLCRLYEERNVIRGFQKIEETDLIAFSELGTGFDRRSAFRVIQADARFAAAAQRMLLRALVPLVSMLVGTLILLLVNPLSIAVLIGFALLSAFPIWLFSRRAFQISQTFESQAAKVSSLKSETLDSVLQSSSNFAGRAEAASRFEELPRDPVMKSFMDTFELRFNVMAQAGAASGLLSAAVIAIVTGVFAWQALRGNIAWSFVVLHFVALQFIFQAIQRITALFVSMNRFYAQLKRYFEFVQRPPTQNAGELTSGGTKLPLTLRSRPDKAFKMTLKKGGRAFVVSALPLDRFSLYSLLLAWNVHENESAAFLREPVFCASSRPETIRFQPKEEALVNADRILEIGIDQKRGAARPSQSEREAHIALRTYIAQCFEIASTQPPVCFLDQRILNRLMPAQMEALLEQFGDTFVFVYAVRNLQPARTWGIEEVIVFNGQYVAAVMTMDEALADRGRLVALTEIETSNPTDIDALADDGDAD